MIVQIRQEDVVGNNRPLHIVQAGEAFQIGQKIVIEGFIRLGEVTHDFGSARNGELEMLSFRYGEGFRFGDVLLSKGKLTILEDCIDQLTFIILANIYQAGEIG